MINLPKAFWNIPQADLFTELQASPQGLPQQEVFKRLREYGFNAIKPKHQTDAVGLFLNQFKSPITLILIFAAILSFVLQDDRIDALIIFVIILASAGLGFWQEKGATDATQKLLAMVQVKAMVRRENREAEIPIEDIVPGDIVILNAGDIVPADCLLLSANDLFVDEATLTGETYPVEKFVGLVAKDTALAQRTNSIFMGTHVVSGQAEVVVVATGKQTIFGSLAQGINQSPNHTDFEHSMKQFGYFLMVVTFLMILAIFAINVSLHKPVLDSFLFTLALAVGLTPQLLPAIISINLAHGAKRMARQHVIVKHLPAIENFGSMDILCADKTGTLTQGVVSIKDWIDQSGKQSSKTLLYAYLNASFETSFLSPIDDAIRSHKLSIDEYRKVDEIPYDFIRKRLSVVVNHKKRHILITKGAVAHVLAICQQVENADGQMSALAEAQSRLIKQFEAMSTKGLRVLAVAYKNLNDQALITKQDETDLTFLGFLVFSDPIKADTQKTIADLREYGVHLKIVTGDNVLVTRSIALEIGIAKPKIITGQDLDTMSDEALQQRVSTIDAFAEIEPNQKERIIMALRKAGHVVGYLGDGINDASAMTAADVAISVNSGVDIAKQAASIILLKKDLDVLKEGILEGRRTFGNTLKYIFMATSANFGNMFSMAGASLFLPFLPLLPKQILLLNIVTDIPELTIATDRVDQAFIRQPQRFSIHFMRNFMIVFGSISSLFDFLTFGALFYVHATKPQFQTGWFLESIVSACVIILVVRTRQIFFKSRPSTYLVLTTFSVIAFVHIVIFSPLAVLFGFTPLPLLFVVMVEAIVCGYIVFAEIGKRIFYYSLAK